jgi:hypothetical protein
MGQYIALEVAGKPIGPPPSQPRPAKMSADGWVLPEKWSEELVDEKGDKMSKR